MRCDSRRHRQPVLACVTIFFTALFVAGTVGAQPAPRRQAQEITELERTLVPSVTRKVEENLRREIDQLAQNARETQQSAGEQVMLIVHLIEIFLTLLAVMVAVLTWLGLGELRAVRKLRQQAEDRIKAADHAAQQFEENSLKITSLRAWLDEAGREVDASFPQLPDLEGSRVLGQPAPSFPPETTAVFEDADIVLVVCHQLKIGRDGQRMARSFSQLARYWRTVNNYPRALARSETAVKLDPTSIPAHRGLALALAYYAAEGQMDPETKASLLRRAEDALIRVRTLQGKDEARTLHDFAWVYDERGDYARAVDYYKRARDLDREEAQTQARPEQFNITYDLACSLAKAGDFENTLHELETIVDRDRNWESIEQDTDFETLRADVTWGPILADMIARARAQHSHAG